MSTADKINYAIAAKEDIKAACYEKGVSISAATPFGQYGNYIRALEVGPEVIPVTAKELYITENGVYIPKKYNVDYFSKIIVEVSGGSGGTGTPQFISIIQNTMEGNKFVKFDCKFDEFFIEGGS